MLDKTQKKSQGSFFVVLISLSLNEWKKRGWKERKESVNKQMFTESNIAEVSHKGTPQIIWGQVG